MTKPAQDISVIGLAKIGSCVARGRQRENGLRRGLRLATDAKPAGSCGGGTSKAEPEMRCNNSLPTTFGAVQLFRSPLSKAWVKPYRYPDSGERQVHGAVSAQAEFEHTIVRRVQSVDRELDGYFSEMVEHLIAKRHAIRW